MDSIETTTPGDRHSATISADRPGGRAARDGATPNAEYGCGGMEAAPVPGIVNPADPLGTADWDAEFAGRILGHISRNIDASLRLYLTIVRQHAPQLSMRQTLQIVAQFRARLDALDGTLAAMVNDLPPVCAGDLTRIFGTGGRA